MRFVTLLLTCLIFTQTLLAYPQTPDVSMSFGVECTVNDIDFVEFRYGEQIPYCTRNVLSITKTKIYDSYAIPENERRDYTIDHIIPLSIGGNNEVGNLWPEHREVKSTRPNLEYDLFVKVRDGLMTKKEAIAIILKAKFTCCGSKYDRK